MGVRGRPWTSIGAPMGIYVSANGHAPRTPVDMLNVGPDSVHHTALPVLSSESAQTKLKLSILYRMTTS